MISRILGAAALGLIALLLVGATTWAYTGYQRMRAISAVMTSCVQASKVPGARSDTLDRCLAAHGIAFNGPSTLGEKARNGATETSVTSNDSRGLLACSREPVMAHLQAGSSAWASTLALCLKRRGDQATIERQIDLAGGMSFSVKQPALP